MPKNSEVCSRLCILLLQSELLKLRRPDLRPVEPGSLISLAGLPRGRPPKRSDSGPAIEFIRESLAEIPKGDRPRDELALFMDALSDLNRSRVPAPPPEAFDPALFGTAAGLRERVDANVQEALSRSGLVAVPLPVDKKRSPLVQLNKVIPGIGKVLKNPDTAEAACRFIGAFFLASLLKPDTPPRVRLAAGVAAFGCAIGVSRGT